MPQAKRDIEATSKSGQAASKKLERGALHTFRSPIAILLGSGNRLLGAPRVRLILSVVRQILQEDPAFQHVRTSNAGELTLKLQMAGDESRIDKNSYWDSITPMAVPLRQLLLTALAPDGSGRASGPLVTGQEQAYVQVLADVLFDSDEVQAQRRESQQGMSDAIVEDFKRDLRAKLAELPSGYEERSELFADLQLTLRAATAERLEETLNQRAGDFEKESYEQKAAVARWVNGELRRLGVAVRCPKTGKPAFLVGHPGGRPGIGRFQLEITLDNGRPHRTVSSTAFPHLTLMAAPLGSEAEPPSRPSRSR